MTRTKAQWQEYFASDEWQQKVALSNSRTPDYIRKLGATPGEAATTELLDMLDDVSLQVQADAADELVARGPDAMDRLLTHYSELEIDGRDAVSGAFVNLALEGHDMAAILEDCATTLPTPTARDTAVELLKLHGLRPWEPGEWVRPEPAPDPRAQAAQESAERRRAEQARIDAAADEFAATLLDPTLSETERMARATSQFAALAADANARMSELHATMERVLATLKDVVQPPTDRH